MLKLLFKLCVGLGLAAVVVALYGLTPVGYLLGLFAVLLALITTKWTYAIVGVVLGGLFLAGETITHALQLFVPDERIGLMIGFLVGVFVGKGEDFVKASFGVE